MTLQAVLKEPVFYWADLGDGPALTVSRVTVAADGTQAGSPVAAVPLTGPASGPDRRRGRAAAETPPARGAAAAGLPRPQWRLRLAGSVQARDRRGRRRAWREVWWRRRRPAGTWPRSASRPTAETGAFPGCGGHGSVRCTGGLA